MKCYDYKTNQYDTAGNCIMGHKCFCGTTGCMQQNTMTYGEIINTEQDDVAFQKEFYRKTLHSKLLCNDNKCDICN